MTHHEDYDKQNVKGPCPALFALKLLYPSPKLVQVKPV